MKYLINYAINSCEYIAAANEGDAVAVAAGAYLGGRKSIVLMQNSGDGYYYLFLFLGSSFAIRKLALMTYGEVSKTEIVSMKSLL